MKKPKRKPIDVKTLRQLNLPRYFITWLKEGRMEAEVARCRAEYYRLVAALNDFEARNPEAAKAAPWAASRQKWKDAGRPEPQWYELLCLFEKHVVSVTIKETSKKLLGKDWTAAEKAKAAADRSRYHQQWKIKNGITPAKGYETRSKPWHWKT